jgi:hypothetical protein
MATHELAKGLAGLGRYGDSMLMHVHPAEVAGLQALAESQGTTLTRNPHTGMPEAFNLMNALASLAPTLVGVALAPGTGGASLGIPAALQGVAPIAGGALTGALIAQAKGENALMGGLTGGLGGAGGSSITKSISGFGASAAPTAVAAPNSIGSGASIAAADKTFPNILGNAGQAGQYGTSVSSAPSYGGPVQGLEAGSMGPNFNPPANIETLNLNPSEGSAYNSLASNTLNQTSNLGGMATTAATGASPFMEGFGRVMDDPMEFLSQNKWSVGTPIAMAGLAGLEPSDLYPVGDLVEDKFDPRATLNLGGKSKLRLLAGGGIASLYSNPDGTVAQNTPAEGYGAARLNNLSDMQFSGYKRGGFLDGPGDGMSDSIPATIEGKQPARLADGEFVIPADVVSHLGNGSTKAGAKQLYSMMDRVRKARTGNEKQGKQINPRKHMVA